MPRVTACILAVAIAVSTAFAAAPPVSIDIRGQMGSAPFYARVRMTVDPHPGNRHLCLQWTQIQGGSAQRTSCQSLEGDQTAKTYWQMIKELPSGKWDVVAYVVRNDEQGYLSNRITLHVLGPNYESDPVE